MQHCYYYYGGGINCVPLYINMFTLPRLMVAYYKRNDIVMKRINKYDRIEKNGKSLLPWIITFYISFVFIYMFIIKTKYSNMTDLNWRINDTWHICVTNRQITDTNLCEYTYYCFLTATIFISNVWHSRREYVLSWFSIDFLLYYMCNRWFQSK